MSGIRVATFSAWKMHKSWMWAVKPSGKKKHGRFCDSLDTQRTYRFCQRIYRFCSNSR